MSREPGVKGVIYAIESTNHMILLRAYLRGGINPIYFGSIRVVLSFGILGIRASRPDYRRLFFEERDHDEDQLIMVVPDRQIGSWTARHAQVIVRSFFNNRFFQDRRAFEVFLAGFSGANAICRFQGQVDLRPPGIQVRISGEFTNLALFHDGNGGSVHYFYAVCDSEANIFRRVSELSVRQVSVQRIAIRSRAVRRVREVKSHAWHIFAAGLGEDHAFDVSEYPGQGAKYVNSRRILSKAKDFFFRALNFGNQSHPHRILLLNHTMASRGRFFRFFHIFFRHRIRHFLVPGQGLLKSVASMERR